MAADLSEALANLCHADAGLALSFGSATFFYVGKAFRASLPRCELIDVSGTVEGEADMGLTPTWDARGVFQISTFAGTRAQARALGLAVARVIERADAVGAITCDQERLLRVRRMGRGIDQLDPDPGPDGGQVWGFIQQFSAHTEFDVT